MGFWALRLNDLIDWFRGWCPRETLLGEPRLQRVSLDVLPLRRLLREHPLGVLLTVLSLTAGLGGFLIPKTLSPARAEVWILTGSHLSLSSHIDGFEHRVSATTITPPYKDEDVPFAVIYIWDEEGESEIEGVYVATTFVAYPSRNITVVGSAPIGLITNPEWRRDDVEMSRGAIHYRVYLGKDEWERAVGEGGGPTQEHFEVNLLSLEEAEGVSPPYNLTCRGVASHRLESSIDSLQREHMLTFWSLHVEEGSVMVTRFADLPKEEIFVINPWLKILQGWRLPLTTIGIIAVALLYRAGRSSFNRIAKA